jgi:hypothetical protein
LLYVATVSVASGILLYFSFNRCATAPAYIYSHVSSINCTPSRDMWCFLADAGRMSRYRGRLLETEEINRRFNCRFSRISSLPASFCCFDPLLIFYVSFLCFFLVTWGPNSSPMPSSNSTRSGTAFSIWNVRNGVESSLDP